MLQLLSQACDNQLKIRKNYIKQYIYIRSIGTSIKLHTILDTDNLPFPADMPHTFSAGSHAAIRGSPARQCADRPQIYIYSLPRMNAEAYMLD